MKSDTKLTFFAAALIALGIFTGCGEFNQPFSTQPYLNADEQAQALEFGSTYSPSTNVFAAVKASSEESTKADSSPKPLYFCLLDGSETSMLVKAIIDIEDKNIQAAATIKATLDEETQEWSGELLEVQPVGTVEVTFPEETDATAYVNPQQLTVVSTLTLGEINPDVPDEAKDARLGFFKGTADGTDFEKPVPCFLPN